MVGSAFEPIKLPDEVWRREETAAILRARNIGALFRLAKKYTGASQNRIAAATGISQPRVNSLMGQTGGPILQLEIFERIANGLHMPDQARIILGIAPRTIDVDPDNKQGDLSIKISRLAIPDLINANFIGANGGDSNSAIAIIGKWDVRGKWFSAPQISITHIGIDQIKELERTADAFRSWDHQFGGGLRRKAVIGQLADITDLLNDPAPAPVYRRLAAVASRLAMTAAQMSGDSGRNALAFGYLELAL